MWSTALDDDHRSTSMLQASIDVLVEPDRSEARHLAVVHVTVPPGATLPPHDHGDSDAVLIPLAGELLLFDAADRPEHLQPGRLAVVAAHERVRAENQTAQTTSMLVCFAPPSFVEALGGGSPQPPARPSA